MAVAAAAGTVGLTTGSLELGCSAAGRTRPTDGRPIVHVIRNAARRLVAELAVIVVLVGLPIDFPRRVAASTAWSFLLRHPSELLHALLGAVVLAESAVLLVRTVRSHEAPVWQRVVAPLGLLAVLTAVGSGVGYVDAHQADLALTLMSTGWLVAIVCYGVAWRRAGRALAAARADDAVTTGPTSSVSATFDRSVDGSSDTRLSS